DRPGYRQTPVHPGQALAAGSLLKTGRLPTVRATSALPPAAGGSQRKLLPFAAGGSQRKLLPFAAGGSQRKLLPFAAGGSQRKLLVPVTTQPSWRAHSDRTGRGAPGAPPRDTPWSAPGYRPPCAPCAPGPSPRHVSS